MRIYVYLGGAQNGSKNYLFGMILLMHVSHTFICHTLAAKQIIPNA